MRNDEMIRELSDNELDQASGGDYCVRYDGVSVGCSYTAWDLGQDMKNAFEGAARN